MANIFGDVSNFLTNGQSGAAQNQANGAAGVIANTQDPNLTALIPKLQLEQQQGQLTPAEMQAAQVGSNAYNGIQTNGADQTAMNNALAQEQQVAGQGGETAIMKAQLNDVQQQLANQNAAQQSAIQNQAQQQGVANGGTALAAKQLASQGNATAAANAGAGIAANAQAQALQALQNYGTMAQSQQAQQFGQQAQAANAQNAINAFNAGNTQQANATNAANQQSANTANFSTANNINAANTGITNQNLMMPLQTAQQQFTNSLGQNKDTSDAMLNASKLNQQGAVNQQNATNSMLNAGTNLWNQAGGASGIGSALASVFSDERAKEDVKDGNDDVEAMMEKLTGKKFKYKKGTLGDDGGKEHLGVMAQDAEKGGLPVLNTEHGKIIVDNDSHKGAVLAALGNLHKRISELEKA